MRLIDADEYLEKVCTYKKTGCGSCKLQTACPADEPVVKAIPIDWIERWLDRVTGTKDGDDISKYHDLVKGGILFINMLERDWERENE